jgi:hypothetical protein
MIVYNYHKMSGKPKTMTPEEKKLFFALTAEHRQLLMNAKAGKKSDRTKIDDLTNQWRKLKKLPPLQPKPQPKLEDKKEEPKNETLTSSPVIVGEKEQGPVVMLSPEIPDLSLSADSKRPKEPVLEKKKKEKLVKIPKKEVKEDAVMVEKPKNDPQFDSLLKMFEGLSKEQREQLIKSGQGPKSAWSLFG